MTCRDDYPRLAWIEQWDTDDGPECRQALDELDNLRSDVSTLLTLCAANGIEWPKVWPAADAPPKATS